jgi:ligand-binding sensor domain-containing protein
MKLPQYICAIFFLFLTALAGSNPASAQSNIEFSELQFPEIKQNPVYDIIQDSRGMLWLATFGGLYTYDGYHVNKLQTFNKDRGSLPIGPAGHLYLSSDNHLWIAYQNEALVDYNLSSGMFDTYRADPNDQKSILSNRINVIIEDHQQKLWIGTYQGLDCFDIKTKTFTHYKKNNSGLAADSIKALAVDSKDNIYIGCSNKEKGLYMLNRKTMHFDTIIANKSPDYYTIERLKFENDNKLWCSNDGCVFRMDLGTQKLTPVIGKFKYIAEKQVIGEGPILITRNNVWIGSYTGLFIYQKKDGQIIHFAHDEANPSTIISDRILCLFRDRSGNTWIGTDEGLEKISKIQYHIHIAKHINTETALLRKRQIRCLYVDPNDHTIWHGTSGEGLQKLNADGTWSQYLFNYHFTQYGYNYLNDIHPLKNGNLALSTWHGLQIFDTKNNRFIINWFCVPYIHGRAFDIPLWTTWEDENGIIWLGSKTAGLFLLDLSGRKIIRADSTKKDFSIWQIKQDRNKPEILWLGTDKGLYYVNRNNTPVKILPAPHPAQDKTPIQANVFLVYQDQTGNLWLSTTDAGLIKYSIQSGLMKKFTTQNGLPSDVISGILGDRSGNLWISCPNGIFVFNIQTEQVIRKYNQVDGLSTSRFNFRSCLALSSGEMYFGSTDGINYFYPDSIKANAYQPRLFITSFKTLYNERLPELPSDSVIVLPYEQNSFALEYASDDYNNPGKNLFSFQLEGFSKEWSKPSPNNYTAFTNLNPGTYVFKLRGSNSDGIWSSKALVICVKILPPFWRTWWFYLICIVFFLSITGYILYIIFQQKELKRKKIYAELAALRTQLNPHFVFNSLTTLEHFIVVNQNKLAIEYLVKFSRLMRMILEYSGEEFITLQQEMDFLHLYIFMESLRLKDKVLFTIKSDPELDLNYMLIPPMLLQPLIENAILHGLVSKIEGGSVMIHFKAAEKGFICIVEDNGIGREMAQKNKTIFASGKKSMAMSIVTERIKILKKMYGEYADIKITDADEATRKGTRIEIKIPDIHDLKPDYNPNADKIFDR